MYYIHVRRNLLASLVSGILAVLAGGGGLFAGTEPQVQQAAQPQQDEEKNSLDLFSYDGVYTFRSDFSLPASGISALALSTSATILAALIMDCPITSRRSTDIWQLNTWLRITLAPASSSILAFIFKIASRAMPSISHGKFSSLSRSKKTRSSASSVSAVRSIRIRLSLPVAA